MNFVLFGGILHANFKWFQLIRITFRMHCTYFPQTKFNQRSMLRLQNYFNIFVWLRPKEKYLSLSILNRNIYRRSICAIKSNVGFYIAHNCSQLFTTNRARHTEIRFPFQLVNTAFKFMLSLFTPFRLFTILKWFKIHDGKKIRINWRYNRTGANRERESRNRLV